ncbi:MAG: family 2 glycosyl transferase [Microgenomates group bacterium Gr01-1014_7]|nr:MAG: family 2 glycosyl transferase [Microgenomates group bacterium Gr01-1014_7]
MKKTIWVNTIVNNEENFIWFSVMSVIDHVDKVLIYDTGSTDKTVEIIKKIIALKVNKIILKQVGEVDTNEFPKVRQEMLDVSQADWILVLDGDEIWWEKSITLLKDEIKKKGEKIDGIVVPMVVSIGDIYHSQEEKAGKYNLLGRVGHYSLRAINKKITGLHVDWPYGKESYLDENNLPVQEREKIIFLDAPYLHVTHLKRSSVKRKYDKYKSELGQDFPNDKLPEIFYKPHPEIVPAPFNKISGIDLIKAKLLSSLRKIKRKLK